MMQQDIDKAVPLTSTSFSVRASFANIDKLDHSWS